MITFSRLRDLLLDLFAPEEFHQFLFDLEGDRSLLYELPVNGSHRDRVEAALASLERKGRIDGSFFDRLAEARKYHVQAVIVARAAWQEALEQRAQSVASVVVNTVTLMPGLRLGGGAYVLRERIGGGGFGQVWKALDAASQTPVAIKILHPHHAANPGRRERFLRSAATMRALEHPNLVRVLAVSPPDGDHDFHVMELVTGENLQQARVHGRCTCNDALRAIIAVAKAVRHAHAHGLIHGDIKPANILLSEDGGAKLTDFDLTDVEDIVGMTVHDAAGSVLYTAPEVLSGAPRTAVSADIYSLGMTVFFALAGKDLTINTLRDPSAAIEALRPTAVLRRLLSRAIQWDPRARQSSAQAFLDDLELCLLDAKDERLCASAVPHVLPALPGKHAWVENLPVHVRPLRILFVGSVLPATTEASPFPVSTRWSPLTADTDWPIEADVSLGDPSPLQDLGIPDAVHVSCASIEALTPERLPAAVREVDLLLAARKAALAHREPDASEAIDPPLLSALLKRLGSETASPCGDALLRQRACARIDAALTTIACAVFEDPALLAIRASVRSLRLLSSAFDEREPIEIWVWNIDREAFLIDNEDCASADQTMLAEILRSSAGRLGATPFSIVCCGWSFGHTWTDGYALLHAARVCAAAQAVFLVNADHTLLHRGEFVTPSNWASTGRWRALAASVEMEYAAICFPRFLLREGVESSHIGGMELSRRFDIPPLWGCSSVLLTYCAIRSFLRTGICSYLAGLQDGLVPAGFDTARMEYPLHPEIRDELLQWGVTPVTCVLGRGYLIEAVRAIRVQSSGAEQPPDLFPAILLASRVIQGCRDLFREHYFDTQDSVSAQALLRDWLRTSFSQGDLLRAEIHVIPPEPYTGWRFHLRLTFPEPNAFELEIRESLK